MGSIQLTPRNSEQSQFVLVNWKISGKQRTHSQCLKFGTVHNFAAGILPSTLTFSSNSFDIVYLFG